MAQLKVNVIRIFAAVTEHRTNFRLATLLDHFKQRALLWQQAEVRKSSARPRRSRSFFGGGGDGALVGLEHLRGPGLDHYSRAELEARDYVLQLTPAAVDALFGEFEAMFPGGGGEAAALELTALCGKPDLDQALIDCIMFVAARKRWRRRRHPVIFFLLLFFCRAVVSHLPACSVPFRASSFPRVRLETHVSWALLALQVRGRHPHE